MNLKKILIIFNLIFFTTVFAKDFNLKIKNLPDSYKDIFNNFFYENLKLKDNSLSIDIDITWIVLSYNICFFLKKENKPVENICFTSNSGEDLLTDIGKALSNSKYLSLKQKIKTKKINLEIITTKIPTEKRFRVISRKGDTLIDYKNVFFKRKAKNIDVKIEDAIITGDIIIISKDYATYLLKKFLNGYKINKIYLNKTEIGGKNGKNLL